MSRICPLYSGPQVKIKISLGGDEYLVFKNLLCAKSPYFADMFNGIFKEAQDQAAILQEADGLTVQSFEAFLRWLYTGKLESGCETPSKNILAAINLSRVAAMWLVSELEPLISNHIKSIMMRFRDGDIRANIHHIDAEIIASASHLPAGHLVRQTLAKASVQSFLLESNFKLARETQLYPEFAADIIREIKEPLIQMAESAGFCDKPGGQVVFIDPFSRRKIKAQEVWF